MDEQKKFTVVAFVVIAFAFAAILLLALGLYGCSGVQMSPHYKHELESTNVLVQSLNNDCKGGDPNACSEGLDESAKILQLLVDAADGRAPQKGENQ